MTIETKQFGSLEEVLGFIQDEIKKLEAEPTQTQPADPEMDTEDEAFDWELRRQIISYVTTKMDFNSPDEFKAYVEFIYGFMVEAIDE